MDCGLGKPYDLRVLLFRVVMNPRSTIDGQIPNAPQLFFPGSRRTGASVG